MKSKHSTSAVWNFYHQTTDKLQEESRYISATLKKTFHIPCSMTPNPQNINFSIFTYLENRFKNKNLIGHTDYHQNLYH